MNREKQILEAMGLGPIWQARDGFFGPRLPAPAQTELVPAPPETESLPMHGEPAPIALPPTPAPLQEETPAAVLVTALSWDELERTVSACDHCRLCKTRTQTVYGRGNPKARWLLVGEAPGEQEDKQGLPFVGRAGRLLDNILEAAHLSSEHDVYIANVLKCRPPGNRNPAGDEIAACQDYLQQQIRLIQPEIIVALGRFAAQTLLSTDLSISRLRGQVHHYQGLPLVVTYHPAYLLRNPPDKSRAWADWLFAHRTLEESRTLA